MKQHNKFPTNTLGKQHLLSFGSFGLKTLTPTRLSESQFQAIFWLLNQKVKGLPGKPCVKLWSRFLPNLVLTKLNSESRMGKGKGTVIESAMFLKPGQIIFELDNLTEVQCLDIFLFIQKKFPAKLALVYRPLQIT